MSKLELKAPFIQIKKKIFENGFQILPITFDDTLLISSLPLHHRDPFDRIIIAQSITNDLKVISRDGYFERYGIQLIW